VNRAVLPALVVALGSTALFFFWRGWAWSPSVLLGAAVGILAYSTVRAFWRLGPLYRRKR
jgi:hypothetical protein